MMSGILVICNASYCHGRRPQPFGTLVRIHNGGMSEGCHTSWMCECVSRGTPSRDRSIFRELLFGPALSRVGWVSPLVLTGSCSSSHTSAGCWSEARSQYAATVSRRKLQHGSSLLYPLQVELSSVSQPRFSCSSVRFPRHIARPGSIAKLTFCLQAFGRVRSTPAMQLYGSFCRGSLYVKHACVLSMLWWDHPATTCSYDHRSLNIPPVKTARELVGVG